MSEPLAPATAPAAMARDRPFRPRASAPRGRGRASRRGWRSPPPSSLQRIRPRHARSETPPPLRLERPPGLARGRCCCRPPCGARRAAGGAPPAALSRARRRESARGRPAAPQTAGPSRRMGVGARASRRGARRDGRRIQKRIRARGLKGVRVRVCAAGGRVPGGGDVSQRLPVCAAPSIIFGCTRPTSAAGDPAPQPSPHPGHSACAARGRVRVRLVCGGTAYEGRARAGWGGLRLGKEGGG